MSGYQGIEKRKHPRLTRPFSVSYKKLGEKAAARVTHIKNISEGGLAFRSDEDFEAGEILDLVIILPNLKSAIQAKGKILGSCRISKNLFCDTRLVFTEISEEAKRQIREIVHSHFKIKKE